MKRIVEKVEWAVEIRITSLLISIKRTNNVKTADNYPIC